MQGGAELERFETRGSSVVFYFNNVIKLARSTSFSSTCNAYMHHIVLIMAALICIVHVYRCLETWPPHSLFISVEYLR